MTGQGKDGEIFSKAKEKTINFEDRKHGDMENS